MSGSTIAQHVAVCALIGATLFACPPAAGQAVDSTLVGRFQLAESFIRAGQFERAIVLLEDLHARSPSTYVFFNRLKEAYESTKRYDEAISLLDDRINLESNPVIHLADRGRIYYLKGDEDQASADFDRAIATDRGNASTYMAVYQVLIRLRLFDEAIEVLEEGRRQIGESTLFQRELGYLFGLAGEHGRAMEEYLGLLDQDDRQLGVVRSRLTRTGLSQPVLDQSIPVVERAVRRDPLKRTYRELLAWLYEESDMYREALDVNRAIDRLESEQGRVLFGFASRASSAGQFSVALEAYRIILDRYPQSVIAPEAARGIGQMHVAWAEALGEKNYEGPSRLTTPHYDQALDAFSDFTTAYPNHGLYAYVLLDMARIHQTVFFELAEAQALFTDIVERFPDHPAASEARFELGQIAVSRGRLGDAMLAFTRLEEDLRIGEMAEEARYQIALVHFYRGEFESARTILEAMEENTSTDVANDAIELKVLLFENRGPDSLQTPLRRFADARLLVRQRRLEEAESSLAAIRSEYGRHPLNDDSDYLTAEIRRMQGSYAEAATLFGQIPLVYPESFLADKSLYEAARIYEENVGDPDRALELYTRILTDYPGSLLGGDVRARIRLLRGDGT